MNNEQEERILRAFQAIGMPEEDAKPIFPGNSEQVYRMMQESSSVFAVAALTDKELEELINSSCELCDFIANTCQSFGEDLFESGERRIRTAEEVFSRFTPRFPVRRMF